VSLSDTPHLVLRRKALSSPESRTPPPSNGSIPRMV